MFVANCEALTNTLKLIGTTAKLVGKSINIKFYH